MRKHISTIIAILVFITGLSLLLYPTVSDYWNSKHQTAVVANYSDKIEKMDDQDKQAAIDAAVAYNETLLSNAGRFTPSDSELSLYKSLLNADGTGMMGYITIPEIRCKLAIYHSVDDSVLQVGVGHLEGSSLPVGGSSAHCVISGHRGLVSARLFTDIDRLEKGDLFYLHVFGKVLAYEVDKISVVEPEDYGPLEIEEGKDLCTLLTCTPYGINTQRLMVRGHRVVDRLYDESNITSDAARVDKISVVEPEDYGPLEIEEGKDLCTLLTCTPYGINTQRLMVRGHRVVDRLYDESNITSDAARVDTLVVASCVGVVFLLVGIIVSKIWRLRGREKNNS